MELRAHASMAATALLRLVPGAGSGYWTMKRKQGITLVLLVLLGALQNAGKTWCGRNRRGHGEVSHGDGLRCFGALCFCGVEERERSGGGSRWRAS